MNELTSTPPSLQGKTSRQVPVILTGGTMINGQVQPTEFAAMFPGTRFYVIAASAPVVIQPIRAGAVGASNQFGTFQGQPVKDGFDSLIIRNVTTNPVVALIWIGFDDFINNQVTLNYSTFQQVANPTFPVAGAATSVSIPDLSGTSFTDINGKKWGAISRVCILIFNVDAAANYVLFGASGSGGGVANIYPETPVRLDIGGNYKLNGGSSNVNCIVSEIYNAIAL